MAPIDPSALAPFFAAIVLIEVTPGPNMGYLAALSASHGRVAGFKAVLGVTLGLTAYMLASVIGVTEIIAQAPVLYQSLRWAGVFYLLYLAWEAWRGAAEASPGHAAAEAPFWRGLIANLLNPKAAIFYVTLLPGFISREHGPFWTQALVFGAAHIAVSVVIHGAIVLAAARAGAMLARTGRVRTIRRALAVGIALIAIWLLVDTRIA